MTIVLNGDSGITTPTYGGADTSEYLVPVTQFKNRIINGGMMIDQRNAGASVTPSSGGYCLDRWTSNMTQGSKFSVQQNAGSVTPPAGFRNYLGVTSTSAYSVGAGDTFFLQQSIEGLNIYDLAWGTADAKTVTLSFWVRSSLTGTFGGALTNSAENRSYAFNYTISAANTWEYKTVTIAGDTSGTWLTTNGIGIGLRIGLGTGSTYSGTAGVWSASNLVQPTGNVSVVGTNGATFYITGVQLEVGSTATSFDYRPYGTELALCQRYYYKMQANGIANNFGSGYCTATTTTQGMTTFPVTMRTGPTALEQSGTASHYRVSSTAGATTCSAVPQIASSTGSVFSVGTVFTVASGLTTGHGALNQALTADAYLAWSAEL